jgi:hypothetical protein
MVHFAGLSAGFSHSLRFGLALIRLVFKKFCPFSGMTFFGSYINSAHMSGVLAVRVIPPATVNKLILHHNWIGSDVGGNQVISICIVCSLSSEVSVRLSKYCL